MCTGLRWLVLRFLAEHPHCPPEATCLTSSLHQLNTILSCLDPNDIVYPELIAVPIFPHLLSLHPPMMPPAPQFSCQDLLPLTPCSLKFTLIYILYPSISRRHSSTLLRRPLAGITSVSPLVQAQPAKGASSRYSLCRLGLSIDVDIPPRSSAEIDKVTSFGHINKDACLTAIPITACSIG
ncbi:hypothetical protein BJY04DRAFT_163040 [Aspergillus karnatakaensis]|uniref:uncharacterized protein n=1 Tax=Aspergillus karnatakaensis TaxID=1810916 RepID=UPI003CCDC4D3